MIAIKNLKERIKNERINNDSVVNTSTISYFNYRNSSVIKGTKSLDTSYQYYGPSLASPSPFKFGTFNSHKI